MAARREGVEEHEVHGAASAVPVAELRPAPRVPSAAALPVGFDRLAAHGVPVSRLALAAREARRLGCDPVEHALASGLIDADDALAALVAGTGASRLAPEARFRRRPAGLVLRAGTAPLRMAPDATTSDAPRIAARLDATLLREGARVAARRLAARARGATRLDGLTAGSDRPWRSMALVSAGRFRALAVAADGAAVAHAAAYGLANAAPARSALSGPRPRELALAALAIAAAAFAAGWAPGAAAVGASALLGAALLAHVWLRLAMIAAGAGAQPASHPALPDADLPRYAVLVPLRGEERVVRGLLAALARLDYPPAKLDVLLLVEQGDGATQAAIAACAMPPTLSVLLVPPGEPQTKPRALAVALPFVDAERIVVFDAEDEPEPDQLRKAAAHFAAVGRRVACLQAELRIVNWGDGWRERLFALDYAGLFRVVKPGCAALHLPVPLGGTSNHFRADVLRRVGGWDPWNVTEDADLGLRLARFGYRVESLDSVTWEEAPRGLGAWMRQRRRWLKGFMQTSLVHLRDLGEARRARGVLAAAALVSHGPGVVLGSLLGPWMGIAAGAWLWGGAAPEGRGVAEAVLDVVSVATLGLGAAAMFGGPLLASRPRGLKPLRAALPLLPVQTVLVSVAAALALADLVRSPFGWHKTPHGTARSRIKLRPGEDDGSWPAASSEAGGERGEGLLDEDAVGLKQPKKGRQREAEPSEAAGEPGAAATRR